MDLESLKSCIHAVPFIGMVQRGDQRGRPLLTRLIESSVPGILVAFVLMYTKGEVQQNEIDNLKNIQEKQLTRIERRIDMLQDLILENIKGKSR